MECTSAHGNPNTNILPIRFASMALILLRTLKGKCALKAFLVMHLLKIALSRAQPYPAFDDFDN